MATRKTTATSTTAAKKTTAKKSTTATKAVKATTPAVKRTRSIATAPKSLTAPRPATKRTRKTQAEVVETPVVVKPQAPKQFSEGGANAAGLPESIAGAQVVKAIISPSATLCDWISGLLPFIDLDSGRFAEVVQAKRQKHGLSTRVRLIEHVKNSEATLEGVFDIVRPFFNTVFETPFTMRAYDNEPGLPDVVGIYVLVGQAQNGTPTIVLTGCHKRTKEIEDAIRAVYTDPTTLTIRELTGFSQSGPIESVHSYTEEQLTRRPAFSAFYPYMTIPDADNPGGASVPFSIEGLVRGFKQSDAGVIVLIGPPGTGKSVLMRTLLAAFNMAQTGLCADSTALANPGLVDWMKSFGQESVIGIEDADMLVGKRKEGNYQMAPLLNHVQGTMDNIGNKIIISTNLPNTNTVDEALLRSGRNYVTLVFKLLTPEQANAARVAIGLEPREEIIEAGKDLSLADALNYRPDMTKSLTKNQSMGFGER